jgi:hypothetical protein
MEGPLKLLTGYLNDCGVGGLVRKINPGPHLLAPKDQHGQDHRGRDQQDRFSLWIIVPVRSLLGPIRSVTHNEITQCALNQNKGNSRHNQNGHEQAVNAAAVLGCKGREPVRSGDEKIERSNYQNYNQSRQYNSAQSNPARPGAFRHFSSSSP